MDTDSSSKFIGSLTKFLQSLCNGYVEFNRGVELVGHIYLNIDTGEKVDYILHEKVSKNDENSVTFVSNSFHAQPLDKEKAENKDNPSKSGASSKGRKDSEDDDDDIMIVDQSNSKGVPGSTNSGSIPSRGVKRLGSPNFSDRQNQRIRGSGGFSSGINRGSSNFQQNNRQHSGPSATVTSQHQEGIDIGDVKLEQISKDELMSLASQVNDGGGSRPSHTASSTPVSSHSRSGMWIKQEAADDDNDGGNEGWSHGREDSNSNSGSNLYPVMLHQNPAAYSSGSAFPGFSGAGPSGSQSGANLYGDPLPGTSQDSSGLDPSDLSMGFNRLVMPVPNFSSAVVEALTKGEVVPQWMMVKTVQESARFYLKMFPTELRDSNVYQSIGRAVFTHYPSIAAPGKKPWSKFIKSLSQKIRHLRHRQLRTLPRMGEPWQDSPGHGMEHDYSSFTESPYS